MLSFTLFTALSFSSLESFLIVSTGFTLFMFLLVVLDFSYCSLAVSQKFFFGFFMHMLTRVECACATKGIPPSYYPIIVSRHLVNCQLVPTANWCQLQLLILYIAHLYYSYRTHYNYIITHNLYIMHTMHKYPLGDYY